MTNHDELCEKDGEKDKCETCEHKRDSSNEYCGSCGGGVESNWKEAGWSKDETIKELRTRNAELESLNSFLNGQNKELSEQVLSECLKRDKENSELRTRVADWRADAVKHAQEVLELRARLSTLLKASEGMEKALERIANSHCVGFDKGYETYIEKQAKQALADFRALKETK